MSDTNNAAMFGRTPKRKNKYGAPMATTADAAPVGPVDDPALLANAAVIIRSATPPPAAPAPRKERVMVDPDEHDFRFRDLVTYMAKGLVDHPDDVAVEIVSAGDDGILELSVHADDIGHVIGKQGRTAKSLRLALGAAASRVDRRMDLEIAD